MERPWREWSRLQLRRPQFKNRSIRLRKNPELEQLISGAAFDKRPPFRIGSGKSISQRKPKKADDKFAHAYVFPLKTFFMAFRPWQVTIGEARQIWPNSITSATCAGFPSKSRSSSSPCRSRRNREIVGEIVRDSEDTFRLHTGMSLNTMTTMPAEESLPQDPCGFSKPSFERRLGRSYQIIIRSYASKNEWWHKIGNTARLGGQKTRTSSVDAWMIESSAKNTPPSNGISLQPSNCTSDATEFEQLSKEFDDIDQNGLSPIELWELIKVGILGKGDTNLGASPDFPVIKSNNPKIFRGLSYRCNYELPPQLPIIQCGTYVVWASAGEKYWFLNLSKGSNQDLS